MLFLKKNKKKFEAFATNKYSKQIDELCDKLIEITNSKKFKLFILAQANLWDIDIKDSFDISLIQDQEYKEIENIVYDNDEIDIEYSEKISTRIKLLDENGKEFNYTIYVFLNISAEEHNSNLAGVDPYGRLIINFYIKDFVKKQYCFDPKYLKMILNHEFTHVIDKCGQAHRVFYNTKKDFLKAVNGFFGIKEIYQFNIKHICYVLWSETEFNAYQHNVDFIPNFLSNLEKEIDSILELNFSKIEDKTIVENVICPLLNIKKDFKNLTLQEFEAIKNKFYKRSLKRLDKFIFKYKKNTFNK